ncbi:MAG: SRPBCC domain-containing protein [Chloroflexota bacterium]|nr:SRPBCC domain-containing protein [Chloroflexota bacterium]
MTTATDGKATSSRSTFKMGVGVSVSISARPERIWALLTNTHEFPRWNTTVQSIEGNIALGQTIQLKTTATPERTFKLRVTEFTPNSRMVWQDGAAPMFKGTRTYTLTPRSDGTTDFTMTEVFAGLMLPMIGGSLPDFRPTFERYAADLKREAEKGA